MLYGLAKQGLLPKALGKVHAKRQTPHVAVMVLFVIIVGLQFAGDISQLAGATVLLLLLVFAVVNAALVVLMRREGKLKGRFNVPIALPACGAVICAGLMAGQLLQIDWRAPAIAGGIVAAILALYFTTAHGKGAAAAKVRKE